MRRPSFPASSTDRVRRRKTRNADFLDDWCCPYREAAFALKLLNFSASPSCLYIGGCSCHGRYGSGIGISGSFGSRDSSPLPLLPSRHSTVGSPASDPACLPVRSRQSRPL